MRGGEEETLPLPPLLPVALWRSDPELDLRLVRGRGKAKLSDACVET